MVCTTVTQCSRRLGMNPKTHGKVRLLAFLIPAFFLVVFGFGSGGIKHFAADLRENNRYCYADDEAEKHQSDKECKSLLYRAYEDPVALFTLVLTVATVGLFAATYFLWRATRDLVVGADQTSERQLRAYVGI